MQHLLMKQRLSYIQPFVANRRPQRTVLLGLSCSWLLQVRAFLGHKHGSRNSSTECLSTSRLFCSSRDAPASCNLKTLISFVLFKLAFDSGLEPRFLRIS
ncbi:hypothetical protein CPB83DRAFT_856348 [Crepidotus variabilis]|uniref:Uncharacterized protein n=1 Tax=Crepidotus variabilis TaxID=179855 RepID=A0A9P6EDA2_9AGAR|nr:hypothetical protein CPB83DRAFT_856348 [Crepidotus variabilis]